MAESVIRCAQDFAQHPSAPLRWLEGIAQALANDEDALAALAASLPMESVVLRDLNLEVAQRLHALRAAREDASPEARASALHGLAIAQARAGHREAALRTAKQAADCYRELAAQRPDVFRPDLATSLFVLARCTRDVRGAVDALPFAHEAVATLSLEFLHHQSSHSGLMRAVRRDYLQLCESAGQAPDRELLAPLLPYFGGTT